MVSVNVMWFVNKIVAVQKQYTGICTQEIEGKEIHLAGKMVYRQL